jgi:hypothetical protein
MTNTNTHSLAENPSNAPKKTPNDVTSETLEVENEVGSIIDNSKERKELLEQKKLLSQLAKSQSTTERVKLFGKIMDDYGIDVLVSLVPGY